MRREPTPNLRSIGAVLVAPRFTAAMSVTTIGAIFAGNVIVSVMGKPAYFAIVLCLLGIAASSLAARWREIEWRGLLPISLLAFIVWSSLSIFWSTYQWATLGALTAQVSIAFLGVFVVLSRDAIQVVRDCGDVFRVLIAGSIAVELLAGVIIDQPLPFIGVAGNLGAGGPIQGLFGTRNLFGFVLVIALITFTIELLTNSVRRDLAIASIAAAGVCAIFTQSIVTLVTASATAAAALALFGLRRLRPLSRQTGQIVVAALIVVFLGVLWSFRAAIVSFLNATDEFDFRLAIWRSIPPLTAENPLEGWGWIGPWQRTLPPFVAIDPAGPRTPSSAVNAYFDVALQLGLVGLAIFTVLIGLAVVRAWLVASTKRSRVYLWPALVLVALTTTSLVESVTLVDYGWFLVVASVVMAARELSWRRSWAVES